MTTSSETDVQAGMTAPRRAAGLLRVIATASTIVGLIGGLIIGQAGDDGTAWILLAAAGVASGFSAWLSALWLEWAAAMFGELRRSR